ncbi:MAG: hypothetical protein MPJ24_11605 [Pirellulaceae bacterium]|nr:hypothetical protein [Pirellulaceae bacterium]
MESLDQMLDRVATKEDFIAYVRALAEYYHTLPKDWKKSAENATLWEVWFTPKDDLYQWENNTLRSYLGGIGGWTFRPDEDEPEEFPGVHPAYTTSKASWYVFARILSAATVYE